MKMKKIFGIEAAILLVMVTIIPMVQPKITPIYPNQNIQCIPVQNTQNIMEAINGILQGHHADIVLISDYINSTIEQYGCIPENFTLPSDLQVKFDEIQNEILAIINGNIFMQQCTLVQQDQQQPMPLGGGITKAQGPYPYFWIIPWFSYGIYWKVWLDNYLTNNLRASNIVAMLLAALGGTVGRVLALVVIVMADILMAFNHGNGIKFELHLAFGGVPSPTGIVFIWNIQSQ